MKNLLFFAFLSLCLFSCKDRNDYPKPLTELEKLPPATQTGANKVGCLLDGKAFVPGNYNNSTNCFYQNVGGDYYFVMAFDNKDSNFNLYGVTVGTQKKQIFQGETYNLIEHTDGKASGIYIYNTDNNETNQTNTGKLTITKLDFANHIVSGTFWFDVIDNNGVTHQIREGRFDMRFTD